MEHSPRPHPPTNPPGPVWAPPWTAPSSVESGALQSLKQIPLSYSFTFISKLNDFQFFFIEILKFQNMTWNIIKYVTYWDDLFLPVSLSWERRELLSFLVEKNSLTLFTDMGLYTTSSGLVWIFSLPSKRF